VDLIDRSKINFYHLTGPELRSAIEEAPTVPAVPLEPLAKWIFENLDPRCDCNYCFNEDPDFEDRECCNCPKMSEEQVKEKLKKWMEEQDAAD
jgi:hypothetical protein